MVQNSINFFSAFNDVKSKYNMQYIEIFHICYFCLFYLGVFKATMHRLNSMDPFEGSTDIHEEGELFRRLCHHVKVLEKDSPIFNHVRMQSTFNNYH